MSQRQQVVTVMNVKVWKSLMQLQWFESTWMQSCFRSVHNPVEILQKTNLMKVHLCVVTKCVPGSSRA